MAKAAICFYGYWDKVRVWISTSFVLFSTLSGIVCVWCGVSRGGGFQERVGDTNVDVAGSCFVVAYYVQLCLFVIWCAYVAIEFGDVDFQSCVVSVLLEPFLEYLEQAVVAVYSMPSAAASGCVLGVGVKLM